MNEKTCIVKTNCNFNNTSDGHLNVINLTPIEARITTSSEGASERKFQFEGVNDSVESPLFNVW